MSDPNVRELEVLLMKAVLSEDRQGVERLLLSPNSRRSLEQVMKTLLHRLLKGEEVEKEIVFLSFCERFDQLILLSLSGVLVNILMNSAVCFDHHKLAALLGKLFDEGMITKKILKSATVIVGGMCSPDDYAALVEKLGHRLEE